MISYAMGDAGTGLAAIQLGTYLFLFFTCAAGIPAFIAGSLLMVSKLWDAINDPLIGWMSDHTSSRWGPRLPWMILGAVPLGFFLAATLATKTGNQFATVHSERIAVNRTPLVVPVPTECLAGFLRLLKTKDIGHETLACGFGAADRLLPGLQPSAPRACSHSGRKALVGSPYLGQRLGVPPYANAKPSEEASARNGGFNHFRTNDFSAQIICL